MQIDNLKRILKSKKDLQNERIINLCNGRKSVKGFVSKNVLRLYEHARRRNGSRLVKRINESESSGRSRVGKRRRRRRR